jgi:16S rRNA (guanine527-N7)-methyltransferase
LSVPPPADAVLPDAALADAAAARGALEGLLDATDASFALPATFLDDAERFVGLLLDANARHNLTRIVAPADVARLHLLDALSALPLIDAAGPASALDLGSGGGVPAIVLALARPDVRWTLVDSVRRKVEALSWFAEALNLRNLTAVAERAEVLGRGTHRESYDLVTARACAALPVLAEYALPLTRVGGELLAWKGAMSEEEAAAGGRAAAVLGGAPPEVLPSGVPSLGDHVFVRIHKATATPERYPRRPGVPARTPLG